MSSIFLSHTLTDKAFAAQLSERLQLYGVRTWVDEAELALDASLLATIENHAEVFDYLGVMLSPESVAMAWMHEVETLLSQEIDGRRIKVVPILHRPCQVPGFLVHRSIADFTQDFEAGLSELLNQLQVEVYQHKRAWHMLESKHDDWINYGRPDRLLLGEESLHLVLQYVARPRVSIELLEYILYSIAYWPDSEVERIEQLLEWLNLLDEPQLDVLFDRLLQHPNAQIRRGVLKLVRTLPLPRVADMVLRHIRVESDLATRREALRCFTALGHQMPDELAYFLLETDEDWLLKTYALHDLSEHRACLLISDGSEFADELGGLAEMAGFRLSTLTISFTTLDELEQVEDGMLSIYELIILVRGAHLADNGNERIYDKLNRFVTQGGSLFATTWVGWETRDHAEFAGLLPFTYIHGTYNENMRILCRPTSNELAGRLFADTLIFHTSFERLHAKPDTITLCERDDGTPLFGYRRHGSGVCYYLNTCQHDCLGSMSSPLQTCIALCDSMRRVFEWIYSPPDT